MQNQNVQLETIPRNDKEKRKRLQQEETSKCVQDGRDDAYTVHDKNKE